jgi:hypothetical protein
MDHISVYDIDVVTAVQLKSCSPAQRLSVAKMGWPRFGDEGCPRSPTSRRATMRNQPQARRVSHHGRAGWRAHHMWAISPKPADVTTITENLCMNWYQNA